MERLASGGGVESWGLGVERYSRVWREEVTALRLLLGKHRGSEAFMRLKEVKAFLGDDLSVDSRGVWRRR
ncbi:MAG: hypothetical protein QXM71_05630 [Thermofilum sp.]